MQACTLVAGEGPRTPLTEGGGENLYRGPPSFGLKGGEVRGRILLVVSTGAADTASVEAVNEQSSQGVQKPSRLVGQKRFPGACRTAPEVTEKKEIPAGL